MVAYNFQTDFAPDILSGRKLSTTRLQSEWYRDRLARMELRRGDDGV